MTGTVWSTTWPPPPAAPPSPSLRPPCAPAALTDSEVTPAGTMNGVWPTVVKETVVVAGAAVAMVAAATMVAIATASTATTDMFCRRDTFVRRVVVRFVAGNVVVPRNRLGASRCLHAWGSTVRPSRP